MTEYIMETGMCSLLVCVPPCLYSLYFHTMTTEGFEDSWSATQLLERGSTYFNPIEYRNLTVHTSRPALADDFYQDGVNLEDDETLKNIVVASSISVSVIFGVRFVEAVFMFKPSRAGVGATAAFSTALFAVNAVIFNHIVAQLYKDGGRVDVDRRLAVLMALLLAVGGPLIRVLAWAFSSIPEIKEKGSACK